MTNLKTTLTGIGSAIFSLLSMLAIAPYQLGELSTIIPSDYKNGVLITGLAASFILRCLNATYQKDK